jgi:hypothetical protein
MKTTSTIIILSGILAFGVPAGGQVSDGGIPISFGKVALSAIDTKIMPAPDLAALRAQDEVDQADGLPYRFGASFDVDYTLVNAGTWDDLPDGGRLWRLEIRCPGAYSINLLYSRYHLPPGATLFLYSADYGAILGAFNERNNKDHGQFATAPIAGDVTKLEYYEPAAARGMGELVVSQVVHGYKNILGFGDSGPCNTNINCPEGLLWQDEKRAVAMVITGGGTRLCSGALVNNVRQDQTPYFLTAEHCLGGENTWIFMFRYESPTCDDIEGPTNYTISGSTLLASSFISDFGLVRLSEQPPESYQVYYSGWSTIDVAPQYSTCIHHPLGDIKKISFDYDPATTADYLEPDGVTHWRIGAWDNGTTEGGSSGSPLFDQSHRLIGQLHGGYASCANIASDWFGKFAVSWDSGATVATRLLDWLDPDITGAFLLDGYDPNVAISIFHTPQSDTRDTITDIEIACRIVADTALAADQLWLHYRIAAQETDLPLLASGGPDAYHAFIPAQSAGTTIEYWLTAADVLGNVDTAGVYSFSILYTPAIAAAPPSFSITLDSGDTAVDQLYITNTGTGALDYLLSFVPTMTAALSPAAADKGSGGPDAFGYRWIDSDDPGGPVFNWIDISADGVDITAGLGDDNYIGPFPLGFSFFFYGTSYTQFYVGSNGIIGFDSVKMDEYFRARLPDPTVPNNLLAWLWDDLNITDADNPGARVYYRSAAGRCIIAFHNYPEFYAQPGDVVTAEVIVDQSGTVKFQYLAIAPGFDAAGCSVGIENADGTDGLDVSYMVPYLHDSLAIGFYTSVPWLSATKIAGSISAGGADTIGVRFSAVGLDSGVYYASVVIANNDPDSADNPWIVPAWMAVGGAGPLICGDSNNDGFVNVGDAYHLIAYIFRDGTAPDPVCRGNVNGDLLTNVGDAVYIVNYVFRGGAPPITPCCP